jgi:predicted TIM-barrel fold metal-dependent hydrolase
MLDEMVALLFHHPQVHCDLAVLDWFIPKKEFHFYLKRIVEAGFGDRVMYGSDQMMWPDAIPLSIQWIEDAEFLSESQKRDIFYNNAKRFLEL